MSLDDRIISLRAKHATIDETLDREQHRPSPNMQAIKKMKVEKLRIKEEIERLATRH